MTKKSMVILVALALAWPAMAIENIYVVNSNPDGGTGASWLNAVDDIDEAIGKIGASTTATIHVAPGMYSAGAARVATLDSRVNGKTVTIKRYWGTDTGGGLCPYPADAAALVSSSLGNALWLRATAASGTILWEGIDIQCDNTTSIAFSWEDGNVTTSMTIKDCILYAPDSVAGTWPLVYVSGNTGVSRKMTLDGVTFLARCNKFVLCSSVAEINIRNCTGTARGTNAGTGSLAPDTHVFNFGQFAGASLGVAVIEDNDFTATFSSTVYYWVGGGTLTSGTVLFRGNSISGTADVVRFWGTATGTPKLIAYNNTLRLTTTGDDVLGFVIGDPDDSATTIATGPIILNNDIRIEGPFRQTGHSAGVFLGQGCSGGLVMNNKIHGSSVDQGIFLESQYATVLQNEVQGTAGIILERSYGNNVINNTCISLTGESSHGPLTFRDGQINARQPLSNVCIGNIVYGGGVSDSALVLSAHTGTMTVSSNFLDWNLYYLEGTGTGGVGVIDAVDHGDRTPLEFVDWSNYTGGTQFSDQHSVIGDPMFYSPSALDWRIRPGSPARGVQVGTPALSTWNDVGAWQRQWVPSSGRR